MILALALALQSADKLPPANPLPPPGAEEAAVLAPVNALILAMKTGDVAAVAAVTRAEGGATTVADQAHNMSPILHLRWSEFKSPYPSSLVQRRGTPAIEIDGDIAMVWTPYQATINGQPSYCGYDHFDLLRDGGRWKVLHLTTSKRTTGCETQ